MTGKEVVSLMTGLEDPAKVTAAHLVASSKDFTEMAIRSRLAR
jgi:hypothetical protein